ncbi:MAG: hypothetical protein GXO88_11980 [Chlorobi bacterium]|nr:hypothetical protein [Chlorobiota bacterium]
MKKITVLLLLLTVLGPLSDIRAEGNKFNIALRSSLSMPLGKYGSNNIDGGSFTQLGLSFGADGKWFFSKKIGVGIDFNQSYHPVNASQLAKAMVAADPFLSNVNVRTESYSITTVTLGAYSSFSLNKDLRVEPKLLAGIMFGETPFQLFEPVYFLTGPDYYKITSSKDAGFAFKGGLSLKYCFNDFVAIDLNADLTYSRLKFGFNDYSGVYYKEKDIIFLNLGIGLVINIR